MILVREAKESDASHIGEIFRATYGENYRYPQFYETDFLKKMIFQEDNLILAAENTETDQVVGTASVSMETGAYSDLVGEFGRIAVHPDARGQGVGKKLMEKRVELVENRLHLGITETRVIHPYAQIIAQKFGFASVGFLPQKHLLGHRESVGYLVRYFGNSLDLRRNHPRIIPEAYTLADLAFQNLDLPLDVIVDEAAVSYPHNQNFQLDEMSTEGYSHLLRIERGRLRNREIFGPMRLDYGFFKIRARDSGYLVARKEGRLTGGIGFTLDEEGQSLKVFEMISLDEQVIHYLISQIIAKAREDWKVDYIEIDVSAYSPRMQKTLLELGFLPAAYVPALAFHQVERLDLIKMVNLLCPLDLGEIKCTDELAPLAEHVHHSFRNQKVLPKISRAITALPLFSDLTDEQISFFSRLGKVHHFAPGEKIIEEGRRSEKFFVPIKGRIKITLSESEEPLAEVGPGVTIGEQSLLNNEPHSATATAQTEVKVIAIYHEDFHKLVRLRPDIGVMIYRNMARDLGDKLKRMDVKFLRG